MTSQDESVVAASLLELKTRTKVAENICMNCEATGSLLWRTDHAGRMLCNACGIYHKRHRVDRPVNLWKKPRRKL